MSLLSIMLSDLLCYVNTYPLVVRRRLLPFPQCTDKFWQSRRSPTGLTQEGRRGAGSTVSSNGGTGNLAGLLFLSLQKRGLELDCWSLDN